MHTCLCWLQPLRPRTFSSPFYLEVREFSPQDLRQLPLTARKSLVNMDPNEVILTLAVGCKNKYAQRQVKQTLKRCKIVVKS